MTWHMPMTWPMPSSSLPVCLLQALNVCLKWTASLAASRLSNSTLSMCFRVEKELEKQRAKALKESHKKEKEASAAWQQSGPVHVACRFMLAVAMCLPTVASSLCLQRRRTRICCTAADCIACHTQVHCSSCLSCTLPMSACHKCWQIAYIASHKACCGHTGPQISFCLQLQRSTTFSSEKQLKRGQSIMQVSSSC